MPPRRVRSAASRTLAIADALHRLRAEEELRRMMDEYGDLGEAVCGLEHDVTDLKERVDALEEDEG